LISKLLIKDQNLRLTAKQALNHEWFRDETNENNILHPYLISSLNNWYKSNIVKK